RPGERPQSSASTPHARPSSFPASPAAAPSRSPARLACDCPSTPAHTPTKANQPTPQAQRDKSWFFDFSWTTHVPMLVPKEIRNSLCTYARESAVKRMLYNKKRSDATRASDLFSIPEPGARRLIDYRI